MAVTLAARTRQRERAASTPQPVHRGLSLPRPQEIPDVIEFCTSPQYLNRALYPRQATLLKVIFLQTELFTDYDYEVLAEWTKEFHLPPAETRDEDKSLVYQGDWGIQPDVLERIDILKAEGRPWFAEVLAVIGRRGGKGYIGAICGAYVLWHYICKGDPQGWYGIDRDKRLAALVFAGKKEQAKQNQWRDLVQVIINAPCFRDHPIFQDLLSRALAESLTIFSPRDREGHVFLANDSSMDLASFEILPKEATPMAGRGPASYCLYFDEMAHVVATGANRGADELYECLDGDTRVLTADLDWVRIADVQAGDCLVGYDERPVPGGQRKLREAKVLGKKVSRSAPVRITFEDGSSVVCSDNHRWFRVTTDALGRLKDGRWVTAGRVSRKGRTDAGNPTHLKVGDHIRFIADPWERDNTREGGYVAGIFDGEGTLCTRGSQVAHEVSFVQKPGVVLGQSVDFLQSLGFDPDVREVGYGNPCWKVTIRGIEPMLRLLGSLRPERLLAKAREAWDGKAPRGRRKYKTLVSIERLPEQDLIDIETSTGTFIAEGLVSHNSSVPSLGQFGMDGFIYAGSSPWQMIGKFYELCQQALEVEHHSEEPVYPSKLIIQLTSWDIYQDFRRAHRIPLVPRHYAQRLATTGMPCRGARVVRKDGEEVLRKSDFYSRSIYDRHGRPARKVRCFARLRRAPAEYDDDMRRMERANPETFAVERRSKWAAALDTYLKPELVDRMFAPWQGRVLTMQTAGILRRTYAAHGDPSKSGANFGWAIAHVEGPDEDGLLHVVFDKIHFWAPWHFEDGQVDYIQIGEHIGDDIEAFIPEVVTFDQFNSVEIMQRLNKRAAKAHLPKRVSISEETATRPKNWKIAETFKTALGMNLIHSPYFEQLELEAKFLQDLGGRVDHPTMGPVQTKDVWDAVANVVYALIGDQMTAFMAGEFRAAGVQGSGGSAWPDEHGVAMEDKETFEALGSFARRRTAASTARLPNTQNHRRRR